MLRLIHLLSFLLVFMVLSVTAKAESWNGKVVATQSRKILSPANGILKDLDILVGQKVLSGSVLGYIDATPVYALCDGTVSLIRYENGDQISDTVIEITPVTRYRIIASSDDAYASSETHLIHAGEKLYVRCTADRSHLATGFAANLSGTSFDVFTTAGELYIGEVVNLYRDPDYSYESKVGVGTVVENSLDAYTAEGYLLDLRVRMGEHVERGQLLFTYSSSITTDITSIEDGIITAVYTNAGDKVNQDDVIADLVSIEGIRITISVPETMINLIHNGDTMYYLRPNDKRDELHKAVVSGISHTADGDSYTVYLIPEEDTLPIGMNIIVSDTLK